MNGNPYIEARDKLPSAISTLPPGYLNGNAATLLSIIEELKKSYLVEWKIIQAIKNLDVKDAAAVDKLAQYIEEYHQYSYLDQDRTHCHNIDRNVRMLLAPLQLRTQADRQRVEEVEKLLEPLRGADNDFMDEIELLMDEALAAVKKIKGHTQAGQTDPTQLDAARQEQQAFVQKFDPRLDQLRKTLKQMNTLANELIDRF